MSNIINKALEWKMAAVWFALFSLNSLGTSVMASLTGAEWSQLDGQSKFMICVAVFVNWTGTITAFISKAGSRIQQGQPLFPTGDTQFLTQTHSETDSVNLSPTISGPQPSPAAVTETKNRTK